MDYACGFFMFLFFLFTLQRNHMQGCSFIRSHVFSEGLLFLSFFWVSFHSSCSPAARSLNWSDGIYVPDPCELTYTNTLLLSNAALSLGCAFICEDSGAPLGAQSHGNFSIISFILAWTFISLQIKEFHTLAFYNNDCIFGSIFFFLYSNNWSVNMHNPFLTVCRYWYSMLSHYYVCIFGFCFHDMIPCSFPPFCIFPLLFLRIYNPEIYEVYWVISLLY